MSETEQYLTGQMRPHHPALLASFQAESEALVRALTPDLDIPYGDHPRQRLDFFQSTRPWRGTLAWFHAGYWQARDKADFRFIAPPLLDLGLDVALVNYPLCPDVDLPGLLAAARESVPAVLRLAADRGRGGRSLIAAGHSAGAHISVELALTDFRLPEPPIASVLGVSGVYDLAPLIATPLNAKLGLDEASAHALSPVHRLRPGLPPGLFVVGGGETAAFIDQNARMHRAWLAAGASSVIQVVDGADHFTVLRALPAPISG